jgi:hypothetical protein
MFFVLFGCQAKQFSAELKDTNIEFEDTNIYVMTVVVEETGGVPLVCEIQSHHGNAYDRVMLEKLYMGFIKLKGTVTVYLDKNGKKMTDVDRLCFPYTSTQDEKIKKWCTLRPLCY